MDPGFRRDDEVVRRDDEVGGDGRTYPSNPTAQPFFSTGAATGIHDIAAGQKARVEFGALGEIECTAVTAKPQAQGSVARAARA